MDVVVGIKMVAGTDFLKNNCSFNIFSNKTFCTSLFKKLCIHSHAHACKIMTQVRVYGGVARVHRLKVKS